MWLNLYRQRRRSVRKSLRNSWVHRWLGAGIFHRVLWTMEKNAVAGGLSLGLFIAFTPTIPFQMLLAAGGAIFFRVNLPVALAACWVTNPLTAIPVYMTARQLGKFLIEQWPWFQALVEPSFSGAQSGWLIRQTFYLWLGSLLFSVVAALMAPLIIQCMWLLMRRIRFRKQFVARPVKPADMFL